MNQLIPSNATNLNEYPQNQQSAVVPESKPSNNPALGVLNLPPSLAQYSDEFMSATKILSMHRQGAALGQLVVKMIKENGHPADVVPLLKGIASFAHRFGAAQEILSYLKNQDSNQLKLPEK